MRNKVSEDISSQLKDYFTFSKTGFIHYIGSQPSDFISTEDWLLERSFYREIQSKPFFKNNWKWRVLATWRSNVLRHKRENIQKKLLEKLFWLKKSYRLALLKHRKNCLDMQNWRVIKMKRDKFLGCRKIDEYIEN